MSSEELKPFVKIENDNLYLCDLDWEPSEKIIILKMASLFLNFLSLLPINLNKYMALSISTTFKCGKEYCC